MGYMKNCREGSANRTLPIILVTALLVINGFFLKFNAFRSFNFFDMGSFLDASWRIFIGQRPYVDFMYTAGPVHLYLNAFFFSILGFGKAAVLAHLIIVHSTVIVLTFLIARKHLSIFYAFLCALLTTTCFYWPLSFPWHNQTAHLLGLLALSELFLIFPFTKAKTAFIAGWAAGICVALSLMTKINLGGSYFMVILAVLLTSSKRKQSVFGFVLGIAATLVVFATVLINPVRFFEQTSVYYGSLLKTRGPKLLDIKNWLTNDYWAILLIVLFNLRGHLKLIRDESFRQSLLFFLGIYFIGIIAIHFCGMFKPSSIYLWGFHVAFGYIVMDKIKHTCTVSYHEAFHRLSLKLLTLFTFFLIAKSAVYGYQLIGWAYIDRDPVGTYPMKTKALEGWMAEEVPGKAMDEMVQYINSNIPKNELLLILTDMQILYPLTKRDSYRRIPFNFFVGPYGYFPVPGKQQEEVTKNILAQPPDWIITHDRNLEYLEPTYFVQDLVSYLNLTEFIDSSYALVKEMPPYQIFKRKK